MKTEKILNKEKTDPPKVFLKFFFCFVFHKMMIKPVGLRGFGSACILRGSLDLVGFGAWYGTGEITVDC